MTTGRINQVTVLHARQKPHEAAGTRALAPSPARVSHRPIKSSLRRKKPQDTSPSRTTRPAAPRARVPSPPISHASEALPPVRRTRVGPFGEDYRRAAAPRQRASGTRRISEWLVADWIWPMGNQVHIPHHHPQQRQRRSARFALPGSSGDISSPAREPGHGPIPSGHILQGRRINRSDQGRPTVPERHPRAPTGARARVGGVYTGPPGGPSTSQTHSYPKSPVSKVCQPSRPPAFKGGRRPGALPAFQEVGPSRGPKLPSKLKVSSYRVEGRPQSPPAVHRRPTHARPISSGPKRLTPQECFAPCQCSPSM